MVCAIDTQQSTVRENNISFKNVHLENTTAFIGGEVGAMNKTKNHLRVHPNPTTKRSTFTMT